MTAEQVRVRIETLEEAIRDAYRRMATNSDEAYRIGQYVRVEQWLHELTVLHETETDLWNEVTSE